MSDEYTFIAAALKRIEDKQDTHTTAIAHSAGRIDALEKQVRKQNGSVRGLLTWKHEVENAAAYSAGWAANNKRTAAIVLGALGIIGTVGGLVAKVGLS